MAKIAIISPTIHPATLQLCETLSQYRHEVSYITSAQDNIPSHFSFPILTYFKNWSFYEGLNFFSKYLFHSPDIWHFVFPEFSEAEILRAHWILSALGGALPRRAVMGSFYNLNISDQNRRQDPNWLERIKLQLFLRQMDLITTGTRENLMYLKRNLVKTSRTQLEVLPPLPVDWEQWKNKHQYVKTTSHLSELEILCRNSQPYLFVPTQIYERETMLPLCDHFHILSLGSRPKKHLSEEKTNSVSTTESTASTPFRTEANKPSSVTKNRIHYLGSDLSESDIQYVVENSKGICTALEELSLLELVKIQTWAQKAGKPIIANRRQVELLPGFVQDKKTGWVIDGHSRDILHIKASNPHFNLNLKKGNVTTGPLVDSTINELNRLYANLLNQKLELQPKARFN